MADVLVDTSVWIDYFRFGKAPLGDLVDRLLDEDRIVLCGTVELELLQGARPHELHELKPTLSALAYVETERRDFVAAGERLAKLRRQGITIPASDGLIGILCARHGLELLTGDAHFNHLPEVRQLEIIQ